jgi:diguanylate cyclase (GGDEF)-like protein
MPDEQREESLQEKVTRLEAELEQAESQSRTLGLLLEKKLNEMYVQYHVSRTISSQLDKHEMIRRIIDVIKGAIPFDRVSVYLLDDPRENLELSYSRGLGVNSALAIQQGQGTPGKIVESGEHIQIHDLELFYETINDYIHVPGEEKRNGSYIGTALKVRNTTIGVIGIDHPDKYGLSVDDMDFMALLSHQIAAGIEKAHLFEKIEHLSQHDGLTGLYNHRAFQERLRQELARRDRTPEPLTLVMLDIDQFKQFNDNFGHQAGDSVLKELSSLLATHCRCDATDSCCRYGGEEFAIIMPGLTTEHAALTTERLRNTIEHHAFSIKSRSTGIRVTVSLGVACISEKEIIITPEALIKKADEALYRSKKNGRNCVTFA